MPRDSPSTSEAISHPNDHSAEAWFEGFLSLYREVSIYLYLALLAGAFIDLNNSLLYFSSNSICGDDTWLFDPAKRPSHSYSTRGLFPGYAFLPYFSSL